MGTYVLAMWCVNILLTINDPTVGLILNQDSLIALLSKQQSEFVSRSRNMVNDRNENGTKPAVKVNLFIVVCNKQAEDCIYSPHLIKKRIR